jgi:isocitrate lyase
MPTWPAKCIPTRASIRPTACRPWSVASTTPCVGPIRSRYWTAGAKGPYWFAPIVADAEAGFGGPLNAFELMKQMIDAGAAGVHFEDQLASAKKCGHMGGKVLVPTQEFITKLVAARLAADVCGVPTILVARTDADAATLLTSDIDERDQPFILDEPRTSEGIFLRQKRCGSRHRPRTGLRPVRRHGLV